MFYLGLMVFGEAMKMRMEVRKEVVVGMEDETEEATMEEEIVTVREGSPVTLSCRSPYPWFFCAWSGVSWERECLLQEGEGRDVRKVCGDHQEGGRVVGEGRHCALLLDHVGVEHSGSFLCMLSQRKDLVTLRKMVRLEVTTPVLPNSSPLPYTHIDTLNPILLSLFIIAGLLLVTYLVTFIIYCFRTKKIQHIEP